MLPILIITSNNTAKLRCHNATWHTYSSVAPTYPPYSYKFKQREYYEGHVDSFRKSQGPLALVIALLLAVRRGLYYFT